MTAARCCPVPVSALHPAATPASPPSCAQCVPGGPEGPSPADGVDAAIAALIEKVRGERASPAFVEKINNMLAGPLRAVMQTTLEKTEAAKAELFDVELVPGKPLPRPPGMRRYSPVQKAAMKAQVTELLVWGLIRKGRGGRVVSPVCLHGGQAER